MIVLAAVDAAQLFFFLGTAQHTHDSNIYLELSEDGKTKEYMKN